MAFAPLAPCAAGWVPAGGDTSGGAPDSDDGNDSGTGWSWEWEYDTSGVSRGGDQDGCWAEGDMSYYVGMGVDISGPASLSVSPPDDRWLSVYAEYDYDNVPLTGYDYLDYWRDALISGNVWMDGAIDNAALGPNDDAYTSAWAFGFANLARDGTDYGYGYVMGNMEEFSTANISYGVSGSATQNPGTNPTISSSTGFYTVDYDFTIDVYDDPNPYDTIPAAGGPSVLTVSTQLYVEVDGTASVDVSQGYTGKASSGAEASVDGYSIVDVVLR